MKTGLFFVCERAGRCIDTNLAGCRFGKPQVTFLERCSSPLAFECERVGHVARAIAIEAPVWSYDDRRGVYEAQIGGRRAVVIRTPVAVAGGVQYVVLNPRKPGKVQPGYTDLSQCLRAAWNRCRELPALNS